ncbi:hypothetical protein B0O99DRAFT_585273 [Bisporella sp. PMI_857]|nr:hypothetical protein B0O99DRAFT_585273 [Bisporella sp. PMI_857]
MDQEVSTLLYLHQPRLTFLSFPLEIRNQIYSFALIFPTPIIIWRGQWESLNISPKGSNNTNYTGRYHRVIDHSIKTASLQQLAFNLLVAHPTVTQEAAFVFYNKNTFAFQGEHNWDPIIKWLCQIGEKNRNNLTNIEIDGSKPDMVWQRVGGERVSCGFTREEIYPMNPHLNTIGPPFKVGLVDNINPALEKVFELLGRRKTKHHVTIIMRAGSFYPGTLPHDDDQYPELGWYGMELPNLIENCRALYAQGDRNKGKDLVEVLWSDKTHRLWFIENIERLKKLRWQATSSPEAEDEIIVSTEPWDFDRVIMTYTLKKERLEVPLMAVDPNPFSYLYMNM